MRKYEEILKKQNPSSLLEKEELCKEILNLKGIVQDPRFHPEGDVWNHTMLVVDQASLIQQYATNPYAFMLSALLHDVGKAVCTTIEEDGRIRSIGHENQLQLVQSALASICDEKEVQDYVYNMVRLHMRPNVLFFQKSSQKAYNRLFKQSICPNDLLLLAKADYLGRTNIKDYCEIEQHLKESYEQYKNETA